MKLSDDKSHIVCMQCQANITQFKHDNIAKHVRRFHPDTLDMAAVQKHKAMEVHRRFVEEQKTQANCLINFFVPSTLIQEAPYKLSFITAKNKLPLSIAEQFVKFAVSADPNSQVFLKMSSSRQTITRRLEDIDEKLLIPELQNRIWAAPFWRYLIDESTDNSTTEQPGIFVRYVDVSAMCIRVNFLSYETVDGSPTAQCIFDALHGAFKKYSLPMSTLVSHTSDNASVVISQKNGVAAKARDEFNPKLYVQGCTTHSEVLVAKDAQKSIPSTVENIIKKVLDFFSFSPAKKSKFAALAELNEECYTILHCYHRARWLSLEQCIDRLCSVIQTVAQFFDEQGHDMTVKAADRKVCLALHDAVADPLSP